MADYDQGNLAKQSRRIYKLYVPALDAIANDRSECIVRATTKLQPTRRRPLTSPPYSTA